MELSAFKEYLVEKKLPEEKINAALHRVSDFSDYLTSKEASLDEVAYDQFYEYSEILIQHQQNSYNDYVFLLYYGYFTKNQDLIIAVMEILDGYEMFPNLSKQLNETYGGDVRDEIFGEMKVPPLGTHPKKRPALIKPLIERIITRFGDEESIKFFKQGLRDKYPASYVKPKETFQRVQNIDEFLKIKHETLVNNLEKHYQENSLFFTQPITKEVLDFVRADQEISAGVRKDSVILMKKIPYMTDSALNASNERERRYYVCHNPLIREAFLEEDQPTSPIFCNCSGGFLKNYWEAVFDREVDVEFIESVMTGHPFCKFAIHIPEGLIPH